MDDLETSLAITVYNARGNASGSIVEKFIKIRESTIVGHPVYSLDRPGTLIVVSGPHDEFFNSYFGIWMSKKYFSYGCCRPIRMHEIWSAIGLCQHRVEQLPILRQEVGMRRVRVLPGKHVMLALMISLK